MRLYRAGIGKDIEPVASVSLKELRSQRKANNSALIASLKEDIHSVKLLQSCREDAEKGRMEPVRLAQDCDLSVVTLSPRFAVEQGVFF